MTKREIALQTITTDSYKNGGITSIGTLAYVENRISFKSFMAAANRGQVLRERAIKNGNYTGSGSDKIFTDKE